MNQDLVRNIGSLRVKVMFMTIIIFLSISAISFLVFQLIVDKVTEDLGKILAEKQVAFDKSRSLQPLLRELELATFLVESSPIREWAKNEENPMLKKRAIEELEKYREMFRDKSYFFVIGKSGNYYFNDKDGSFSNNEYRYTLSPDNPKDGWYYLTAASGSECKLNVDQDRKLKLTKVWINCPVTENGKTLGIIGTGINLFKFIQQIVDIKQPGVNNIFIDESGAIQAHRDPNLIDFRSLTKSISERKTIFQLFESTKEQEDFRNLLDSLKTKKVNVETMFVNIAGTRHLAGVAYLDKMGWYNVTLMDIDILIGSGHFTSFAVLMTGVLILTLFVITALLKYFVLDRLHRLEGAVQLVSQGKYDFLVADQGEDEIGRLSRRFNEMANTIGVYTNNLERLVKERTHALTTEVAERKKAEEQMRISKEKAESATKLKDKFVALLAHDLRSPFSSILGLLNVMDEDEKHKLDPIHKDIVNRVLNVGTGMVRMIDELLKISRLQTGTIVPHMKYFDGNIVVRSAIANYSHIATKKGVEIVNEVPRGTRLLGDSDLFGEVIQNLISNAIKFSNKGDFVTLFVPSEKNTTIAIKDTGLGVDEKILPNIFRHEVKTSTPGTSGEIGTGFGLPFSYEIMVAHNGKLTVESVSGKGATFYAELPYLRPRIMIVDDDDITRSLLSRYLVGTESEIIEAKDGEEALALLNENTCHLAVIDINMPKIDGFELLEKIRSNSKTEMIPVIMITADSEMSVRDKAFQMGANDFISKPIEPEDLLPRVKKLLNTSW